MPLTALEHQALVLYRDYDFKAADFCRVFDLSRAEADRLFRWVERRDAQASRRLLRAVFSNHFNQEAR